MKLRRAEGRLLVVVHHEHSQLAHVSPAGNFTRTVVPSPGALSIEPLPGLPLVNASWGAAVAMGALT